MASEVTGIGADQEIDALSRTGVDQESVWNGAKIIYLHQPMFFFVNFEKFEDNSDNTELKLRISGIPDAELLKRIQELFDQYGIENAAAKAELEGNEVKV